MNRDEKKKKMGPAILQTNYVYHAKQNMQLTKLTSLTATTADCEFANYNHHHKIRLKDRFFSSTAPSHKPRVSQGKPRCGGGII